MRTPLETVSRHSRSMVNWTIVKQDTILMMSSIPRIIDKTCPQMVSIMSLQRTAPRQHVYSPDRTGTNVEYAYLKYILTEFICKLIITIVEIIYLFKHVIIV